MVRSLMKALSMCLVMGAGVACGGGTDPVGFGAGGDKGEEPGYPSSGGGGGADGSPPEITSLDVIFDDYASLGEVLRVEVEYTDADEDVFDSETGAGGTVVISVTGEGSEAQEINADIGSATSGSSDAFVDPDTGAVVVVLGSIDSQVSYELGVILIDMEGNESAEASGSYAP